MNAICKKEKQYKCQGISGQLKQNYLSDISGIVDVEEILPYLIIN